MTRLRLTLMFTCLIALSAYGQSEPADTGLGKGNWMIGGTAWFTEHSSFNNIEYSIDPRAAYFLSDKFTVGLNASYYFDGVKNSQRGGIGPFIRYYFTNKRVAPFIEAEYNLGWDKTQIEFSPQFKTSSFDSYGAGVGLDFFITKNVAFESTVKYLGYGGSDKRFSLNIGFQIFLNRKK